MCNSPILAQTVGFEPTWLAVKLISSFLVYIATDGIYRKKAEVVGR